MKPASSDSSGTDEAAGAASAKAAQRRAVADSVQLFLAHWRGTMAALGVITIAVVAGGDTYLPDVPWRAWAIPTFVNTALQAAVCLMMERSASPQEAVDRWLVWLVASVAVNAVLWGGLPLMVSSVSAFATVLACLINAMLLFSIASSPGSLSMLIAPTILIAILGFAALAHVGHAYVGAGYVLLIGVLASNGVRQQRLLRAGMLERYRAEQLARDLREQQSRLLAMERERALLLERHRLTQDMHDGLGSTLIASLAAVEHGHGTPASLAEMLRECIDDLRAVIDSLEPAEPDLVLLLAKLRFRFERRFAESGVRLAWRVDDLAPMPWLGPSEALSALRIVQEAFTNVMKHASARTLTVSAGMVGDHAEVVVEDDGRGLDLRDDMEGRGLPSMRRRAAALGGDLSIARRDGGGTRVCLRLPLERRTPR